MKRRAAVGGIRSVAAFLLLLLAGCAPQKQFLERRLTVNGQSYRYRVWLPPHYHRLRSWPVILYLHGSGERGDDDVRQLTAGLPPLLLREPDRYPAIVVIPQCRLGQEWYGQMEAQALAALEASIHEFRGDRRRVYLTGVSMGGAGVWYFARHPRMFAALVPVCGEVVRQPDDPWPLPPPPDVAAIFTTPDPYATLARSIGRTPAWVFHGSEDPVIPVTESRRMVAALRARGDQVRFTQFWGAGHPIWDRAYAEAELPQWLFARKLPSAPPGRGR